MLWHSDPEKTPPDVVPTQQLIIEKDQAMPSETKLRDFGRLICAVAAGQFMTRGYSAEANRQMILNVQPELQPGA